MKVEPRTYVSIHYTLTLDDGEKADSTEGQEPLGFIQGTGTIIQGLDEAVLGKETGEKFTITIPPEKAYGLPEEDMLRDLPRENFPGNIDLAPGMGFTANGPHGPVSFKIAEVRDDVVVADFNHVLAGRTLTFDVEITEVREPNSEELARFAGEASSCAPTDCAGCKGGCG